MGRASAMASGFRPVLVSAPAAEPVSLAELKGHLRVTHSNDDTELQAYLDAAVAHLDGHSGVLGRCLINQTWRQDFAYWGWAHRLPFPDVSAVSSVTYYDAAGDQQTVTSTLYELVETHLGPEVSFKEAFDAPTLDDDRRAPVSIAFVAGYGAAASDVPEALHQAIKLLAGHWYASREAAGAPLTDIPFGVPALIAPHTRRAI